MKRLTISLSDDRHAALKQAASQRKMSMSESIEEGLDCGALCKSDAALALVRRARAALSEL